MKVLAVIPARGGSKGIPKKNIRLLNGKPLIAYSIRNAMNCGMITDVVVSSDSEEIIRVAKMYGIETVFRAEELSSDTVTLDPVIFDAVKKVENKKKCKYDFVISLQPTSPLLKTNSIECAIEMMIRDELDCVISVVNKPHLSWRNNNGVIIPNYKKRLNRQQLPDNYVETGGFVVSKRSIVKASSRIGGKVNVYPVSYEEGIDIDGINDWVLCEELLKRKKIVFRVDGYVELGLGHIYNCLSLAYALIGHDILFIISKKSIEGISIIKDSFFSYKVIEEEEEIFTIIKEYNPDIWINDVLNTTADYILNLKKYVSRVVTIEDLGDGARYADAVINALYPPDDLNSKNVYSGWKYFCLRDEFFLAKPKEFSEDVKNIIIMFGGTDPSNYNKLLYEIVVKISKYYKRITFNFITGVGYDNELNGVVTQSDKNIYVYSNVKMVTEYMENADIAISSQGRTIFELAAMRVPTIVLSQNKREQTHTFAQMDHGFLNLGILDNDVALVRNTLNWLIDSVPVRRNMYNLMTKVQLKDGVKRVTNIVLGNDL